ncbi:aldo/keto reductase [Lactonifactor longoviformis]|uniref:aldo/keto reductase n=1 Tax=Lactonifactor longoviformis TaxID=341220 RepID=UPI001D008DAE|nr:aldo/keto reductase [Lactonifactor longoviformis]MCB5714708.1 aldo/keto reductase [Lactonifactor longoviformis]MCB5718662.1 aldo/keto reductase [Lactonifactor longoviformis]
MNLLSIGRSGIRTPYISMGTWAIGGGTWWGENDDAVSVRTIEEAVALGIRWFDTAPVYGIGHSEEVLGKALRGRRSEVILSTKCGLEWDYETPCFHKVMEGKNVYRDLSPQGIRKSLENSLLRLGSDYIDILYTHWQTPDPALYPLEETVETLMSLKKEGKIRAVGASNVTPEIIRSYCRYGQLDVIQEKYSILDPHIARDLVPVCRELGVSVQAYSPLEQGLLTGKVTADTILSPEDIRNKNHYWQQENRKHVLRLLDDWKPLTEKYSCSLANLIICFTAASMKELNILCGARRPEQIRDNAKALTLEIEPADLLSMQKQANALQSILIQGGSDHD